MNLGNATQLVADDAGLSALVLRGTGIGVNGAAQLARMLTSSRLAALRLLDLSGNALSGMFGDVL